MTNEMCANKVLNSHIVHEDDDEDATSYAFANHK